MKKHLNLGCTLHRHQMLGVHAIVNARAGRQDLNDLTLQDIELQRDARKIRDKLATNSAIHQFNSRFFRKHKTRLQHLLSSYHE